MYRVVIVEDEKVIRKGIIYVIDWAALDCLVVGEAENGQQGLDMIQRLHPDIVITDVRMPLMDGLEMVRKGQEKQSFETILLSAYDDFDYVQQALHLEACEYLLKPVDNEKLTKAIAGACRKTDRKNEVRWLETTWKESQKNTYGPADSLDIVELEQQKPKLSFYPGKMVRYVQQHYAERISLQNLSDTYKVSAAYLSREFKKEMGCSFNDFLNRYRIHCAIQIMKQKKFVFMKLRHYAVSAIINILFQSFINTSTVRRQNSWNISIESVYRGMTMIRRGIRNDTACCL